MDYSAANTQLWNSIVQIVIISSTLLIANCLRRKVKLVRGMMLPTAVLGGFILYFLHSPIFSVKTAERYCGKNMLFFNYFTTVKVSYSAGYL